MSDVGKFVYARPMDTVYKRADAYSVLLLVDGWWTEGIWDAAFKVWWVKGHVSIPEDAPKAWAPLPKKPAGMR